MAHRAAAATLLLFLAFVFALPGSLSHVANATDTAKPKQQNQTAPAAPAVVEISEDGRFSKDAEGVITDSQTGLQWYPSPRGNYDWERAKSWVSSLNVGGGGWRMPRRSELAGLSTKEEVPGPGFGFIEHVGCYFDTLFPRDSEGYCGYVWSGEARDSSSAWHFDFYNSRESWYPRDTSSGGGRAFAVRSRSSAKQPQASEDKASESPKPQQQDQPTPGALSAGQTSDEGGYSKDSQGVISDKLTGLQWLLGPNQKMDWNEAVSWVNSLSAAGGGWRMPTRSELAGLRQEYMK